MVPKQGHHPVQTFCPGFSRWQRGRYFIQLIGIHIKDPCFVGTVFTHHNSCNTINGCSQSEASQYIRLFTQYHQTPRGSVKFATFAKNGQKGLLKPGVQHDFDLPELCRIDTSVNQRLQFGNDHRSVFSVGHTKPL
ncbi:MAG: hypothetical protein BWY72_01286 [Bacteroidetes bacterium ADurb.Bin416]|nr:MAG: hypothetical protein BWY72_01286 [Bacteroidetes bacterium ADurb.Bin416]